MANKTPNPSETAIGTRNLACKRKDIVLLSGTSAINQKNGVATCFLEVQIGNNKINIKDILNGKKMITEISLNLSDSEKINFFNKILFMIDNCILDFSYHPVANYKHFYSVKTN